MNTEKKPNNPPAFPTTWDPSHKPITETEEGMTLRDYFAAKAMMEILRVDGTYTSDYQLECVSRDAYLFADAMLKEREKQ